MVRLISERPLFPRSLLAGDREPTLHEISRLQTDQLDSTHPCGADELHGQQHLGHLLAGHLDELVDLVQVQQPSSQQVAPFTFGCGINQSFDLFCGQEGLDGLCCDLGYREGALRHNGGFRSIAQLTADLKDMKSDRMVPCLTFRLLGVFSFARFF